jgi:hypothetical protein
MLRKMARAMARGENSLRIREIAKSAGELVAIYGVNAYNHIHEYCEAHGINGNVGAVNVETIIMVFIGVVIVYQLIGQLGTQNLAVQASANISTMGKFAAGLGEWLFPLLGIIALVMLLFRRQKGGSSGV